MLIDIPFWLLALGGIFSFGGVCYLLWRRYKDWQFFRFIFEGITIYNKGEFEELVNRKAAIIVGDDAFKKHMEENFPEVK